MRLPSNLSILALTTMPDQWSYGLPMGAKDGQPIAAEKLVGVSQAYIAVTLDFPLWPSDGGG